MTNIEDGLPIRLQHLRFLDLRPGDTLVVTAPSSSVAVMRELRDYIEGMRIVPDGVTLAILPAGTEVGVLRPRGDESPERIEATIRDGEYILSREMLAARTASGTVTHEAEARRLAEELGVHPLVPPDPWSPDADSEDASP